MIILLLMMGGQGTRFGAEVPKQFIKVNSKSAYTYIIDKYNKYIDLRRIILVVHRDWKNYVQEEMDSMNFRCEIDIVSGGDTRSQSVKNGLEEAMKYGNREDVVLIHDATHLYVDVIGTKQIIEEVNRGRSATLGALQYDTVYETQQDGYISKVIPRQNVVAGASPEAFPLGKIYDIFHNSSIEELEKMTSAGAIAIANNLPMKVIGANVLNLKITHKEDLEIFDRLFSYYFEEDDVKEG